MPAQPPGVTASLNVIDATPLQSSVAVATPVTLVVVATVQSLVTLAGHTSTRACAPLTVNVCTHAALLPQLSVAVHVRLITWLPAQPPGVTASLNVFFFTHPASSEIFALSLPVALPTSVQSLVTSAGHTITGACVSLTVIVCTHVALL